MNATVVIEGGKVLNVSERIEGRNEPTEISPSFDAFVYEGNRVMSHHKRRGFSRGGCRSGRKVRGIKCLPIHKVIKGGASQRLPFFHNNLKLIYGMVNFLSNLSLSLYISSFRYPIFTPLKVFASTL